MSYRHSRRSFLKQTALGTTTLAVAPSLLLGTQTALAAKLSLENVHVEAARRARNSRAESRRRSRFWSLPDRWAILSQLQINGKPPLVSTSNS